MAMGALLVAVSLTAETTMKVSLIFGFVFAGYYALMSALCAADNKKK